MSNRGLLHHIQHPPQPPTPVLACSKVTFCIMPIAQIAIGAVYLGECPRQPYIPIYLVVVGCFGLLLAVLSCLPCPQEPKVTVSPLSRLCTIWNSLSLFLFCWFIAGSVWIYSISLPINYNKTSTLNSTLDEDQYCNKTLYWFAFWTTTLVYILPLLFLVVRSWCDHLVCYLLYGR